MASRKQINGARRQTIETGEANDMEMTDKEELMHDAETGRRYKIAGEVLKEFLEGRKNELIRKLESSPYGDEDLRQFSTELQVIRAFRDCADAFIQRGEIAEEELSHGE